MTPDLGAEVLAIRYGTVQTNRSGTFYRYEQYSEADATASRLFHRNHRWRLNRRCICSPGTRVRGTVAQVPHGHWCAATVAA
jgi:hypothetical protein